jgi:hypothetical protein
MKQDVKSFMKIIQVTGDKDLQLIILLKQSAISFIICSISWTIANRKITNDVMKYIDGEKNLN